MTVLIAALVAAGIGFATGWYGHAWWIKSKAHKKVAEVAETTKSKFTPLGIAYFVMFAVIVGSIIYSTVSTKSQVSASESRQNDRNTVQLACLSRTFQDFLAGNQSLREASAKRDKALVQSKTALRELVYLRVIKGVPDSAAVQAQAQKYMDATQDFIDASKALEEARQDYKVPDFEKRCGKVAARIKNVLYRELQEPQWQAELTSSSLE